MRKRSNKGVFSAITCIFGALRFMEMGTMWPGHIFHALSRDGKITPLLQIHILKSVLDIINQRFLTGKHGLWIKHNVEWKDAHRNNDDRFVSTQRFTLPSYGGSYIVDVVGSKNKDPEIGRPRHYLKGKKEHIVRFLSDILCN